MRGPSGTGLFCRYAFPPNDLGHCGPPGAETLLAGGSAAAGRTVGPIGQADDPADELRSRAMHFEGAWPYLRLIAGTLGLDDPLTPAVVSAYWVGGGLLDRVPAAAFRRAVASAFGGQPGVAARLAAAPDLLSCGPSHAFHVFVVYPWTGLLRSGGDVARSVLDQCRVRWGTVEWVDGERAGVSSSPLTWDGSTLGLGPPQMEIRRWTRGGHAFVLDPRPGDQVSLHWDWVCDRLGDDDCTGLAKNTAQQLESVNRWLVEAS
jgi:Family of unknown function (DUF6390)